MPDTKPTKRNPIRRLQLAGFPAELGRAHGEAFAPEIRRYTQDRVELTRNGSWAGRTATREDVLGLANEMLPAHRAYAPALCDEMEALASACGISAAEALIVGGFTDFVDAVRGLSGEAPEEDDCTAVLTPDALSGGHGYLAQTWDMHDSATEHVVLLDIEPREGPRAFVFSTVGCLGQIGLNEAGIAVGINNLSAARGSRGVTWPLVVRKALAQSDIEAALACVTEAELAGAHNYLLLDAHGRGYNVEAMPGACSVRKLDQSPLVHTNHCLDTSTQRLQAEKAPALLASSRARLARAEALLAAQGAGIDTDFLMAFTRDPVAICQRSEAPHHIESSGAVIMRPATRELHAVWGLPSENEYERFAFAR